MQQKRPDPEGLSDLPQTLDYGRMAKVVQGLKGAIEARAAGE